MAKPLPLIIGGVGLTGAAAGGVFLVRGGGSGRGNGQNATPQTERVETNKQQKAETSAAEKFWESAEAFKKEAKDSFCVKHAFGENLTIGSGGTEITKDAPASGTYFKSDSAEQKSCLIVQWKKESKSEAWNGKLTWLWTFVKGDEGFITFNVVEPSDEEKKLKFTGTTHFMGKASGGNWELKHHKTVNGAGKKVGKGDWDTYFPKPADAVKETNENYWGFIDDTNAVDKVCHAASSGTCADISSLQVTTKKFIWTEDKSAQSSAKPVSEWTTTAGWWDKMYGVTGLNMDDKFKTIKGTWAKSQ